jgi:hypothetical protein
VNLHNVGLGILVRVVNWNLEGKHFVSSSSSSFLVFMPSSGLNSSFKKKYPAASLRPSIYIHHLDHHSLSCYEPSSFFFNLKGMGVILLCPMNLVIVRMKVYISLLIKIIVSIEVILVLVEGFSILKNHL